VRLAVDQRPVEDFAAQGADEAQIAFILGAWMEPTRILVPAA